MLTTSLRLDTLVAFVLCVMVVAGVVKVGMKHGDQADLTGAVALAVLAAGLIVGASIVRAALVIKKK